MDELHIRLQTVSLLIAAAIRMIAITIYFLVIITRWKLGMSINKESLATQALACKFS